MIIADKKYVNLPNFIFYSDARWFMCWDDKENLTVDAVNELKSSASAIKDEEQRSKMLVLFDKFYEVGGIRVGFKVSGMRISR